MYDEVYSTIEDRKNRGAFYTPERYTKISAEYVYNAIGMAQLDGYKDYLIVDRCCGTGNLEAAIYLENIKEHFLLGTIDPEEAKIASERLGIEVNVYDALSREGVLFYRNKIKEHSNAAIIFLENPPYLWTTGETMQTTKNMDYKGNTYVSTLCDFKDTRELDEQFIWSVYHIYNAYAYIHYGPIKSWKSRGIIDKEVKAAYLCDRKYFNASTSAAIPLIYWGSKDKENESIVFDSDLGKYEVKKVHERPIKYIVECKPEEAVVGMRILGVTCSNPQLNGDLYDPENPSKNNEKLGKYIAKKDLLNMLPFFCAVKDQTSSFGTNPYNKDIDYRIIDTTLRSVDKGTEYQKDTKFLQDCMLYSMCTNKHKVTTEKFYEACEDLLDIDHKNSKIYFKYKELVAKTGIRSLRIMELKYKEYKDEYLELKKMLSIFQYEVLRPKMLEYELLK